LRPSGWLRRRLLGSRLKRIEWPQSVLLQNAQNKSVSLQSSESATGLLQNKLRQKRLQGLNQKLIVLLQRKPQQRRRLVGLLKKKQTLMPEPLQKRRLQELLQRKLRELDKLPWRQSVWRMRLMPPDGFRQRKMLD
jgi:hypothetical protein